jgi:hypothetical protein
MKKYTDALRHLYEAMNLENRIESLKLYAAIHVIADELRAVFNAAPENTLPHGGVYVKEKLQLFVHYLNYAVMPVDGDEHSPSQWYDSAGDNLLKVETSLPE